MSAVVLSPYYEPRIQAALQLRPGDILVDGGAHQGKYSIPLSRQAGDEGRVIAVEPDLTNRWYLSLNLTLNAITNVSLDGHALWNREEDLNLYPNGASYNRSVKRREGGPRRIRGRRLETILRNLGVRRLDWVKLDVEGAELEALEGLGAYWARRPRLIVEVWRENDEGFHEMMVEQGYRTTPLQIQPYQTYYQGEPMR